MHAEHTQCAERLRSGAFWQIVLADYERRLVPAAPGARPRLEHAQRFATFRELVTSGEMAAVADAFARKAYEPALPTQVLINKGHTRRKRTVYVFPPRDDLLFKAINRHLQDCAAQEMSPLCHSFQRGKGILTAYRSILADPDLDRKYCIRTDVTDYFNSIDVDRLLAELPGVIAGDEALMHLLGRTLRRRVVLRAGRAVEVERSGVLAGTPLSCTLANLYLRDLDEHFRRAGKTYVRYSDDIILFARGDEVEDSHALIRARLASKGLQVNEAKSHVSQPGEAWEYLGLRCQAGQTDISEHSEAKLKGKIRRIARGCVKRRLSGAEAASAFVQQLNEACYGLAAERREFSWAQWYFPVLTSPDALKRLDAYAQATVRHLATGTRSLRGHRMLPYACLREVGYVPLASAYFAFRRRAASPGEFRDGLLRRIRPGDTPGSPAGAASESRSETTERECATGPFVGGDRSPVRGSAGRVLVLA